MRILFCGTFMPLEFARKLKYSSEAALKFQRNLLQELKKENKVEVLSYVPYMDNIIGELSNKNVIDKIDVNYIKKLNYKNYFILFKNYYKMLYNKLIYTGVSRAKKSLILIGEVNSFLMAVNNDYSMNRKTSLKEQLLANI